MEELDPCCIQPEHFLRKVRKSYKSIEEEAANLLGFATEPVEQQVRNKSGTPAEDSEWLRFFLRNLAEESCRFDTGCFEDCFDFDFVADSAADSFASDFA